MAERLLEIEKKLNEAREYVVSALQATTDEERVEDATMAAQVLDSALHHVQSYRAEQPRKDERERGGSLT